MEKILLGEKILKIDNDDLNEFEDYLSEFKSVVYFDSEICPICGITISDNLSVSRIPLIELEFENETVAKKAISLLEEHGIKTKHSSSGRQKILIPEKKLEAAKIILNP